MLAEFATSVMREDVKREVITHHVFTFHDCLGTQMTQCLRSEVGDQRSEDDCSDLGPRASGLGLQTSDLGQG